MEGKGYRKGKRPFLIGFAFLLPFLLPLGGSCQKEVQYIKQRHYVFSEREMVVRLIESFWQIEAVPSLIYRRYYVDPTERDELEIGEFTSFELSQETYRNPAHMVYRNSGEKRWTSSMPSKKNSALEPVQRASQYVDGRSNVQARLLRAEERLMRLVNSRVVNSNVTNAAADMSEQIRVLKGVETAQGQSIEFALFEKGGESFRAKLDANGIYDWVEFPTKNYKHRIENELITGKFPYKMPGAEEIENWKAIERFFRPRE